MSTADLDSGQHLYALRFEQVNPPLHYTLVELEVRHAVAQQPADAVVSLEERDRVAGTC